MSVSREEAKQIVADFLDMHRYHFDHPVRPAMLKLEEYLNQPEPDEIEGTIVSVDGMTRTLGGTEPDFLHVTVEVSDPDLEDRMWASKAIFRDRFQR